jgi:hypothetical protein
VDTTESGDRGCKEAQRQGEDSVTLFSSEIKLALKAWLIITSQQTKPGYKNILGIRQLVKRFLPNKAFLIETLIRLVLNQVTSFCRLPKQSLEVHALNNFLILETLSFLNCRGESSLSGESGFIFPPIL